MLNKIRNLVLFREFNHSEVAKVKPQIMEENRRFCVIWAIIHVIYWTFCLFMSTRDPLYHQCRSIYAVALAVSAVTLFLSIYIAPKHRRMIWFSVTTLDLVLLVSGIMIARNLAPKTIVVFASVLIVPVSFINVTVYNILLLALNVLLFMIIGSKGMEPETYSWVLSNLIIFSSIGIMLGHFVNKARFERYIFADSTARLAEIQDRNAHYDQLTNLRNRRAYDEDVDRLSEDFPPDCCVVIADINGLKEMNDARGHAAGDELIIGAAECLRRSFEGIDTIYRIGGDEFCVIITDAAYDVKESLARLQEFSAGWKGLLISGISISAGFASAEEFTDTDSLMKAADQRMYASKRKYYENSGKDRRRR